MRYSPLMLSCIAVAVLSACTTMDTKRPDQMYRNAVMNNLQKDNQYNFSGEATIKLQDKNNLDADTLALTQTAAPAAAIEPVAASDAEAVDAAAAVAKEAAAAVDADSDADDEESHHRERTTWNEMYDEVLTEAGRYPLVQSFLKNSNVRIEGAVDLPQGKVEMIPSMNMATSNYGMWGRLLVQVDAKRESILVDTQGYAGWMQASLFGSDKKLDGIKRLEEGALLEIKQPDDMKERYPVRSLLRAMPKGLEAYLNAMEAEKFSLQPMDEYGRELRAAYRVQVSYDAIDSIKWSKALLQGYNQEFLRLQREEPETGISEKSYNEVKSVLLLGAMMLGGDSNECKKEDDSAAAIDAAAATDASGSDSETTSEFQKELACSSADAFEEMKKEMGDMPKVHEDLYLSRTGRVLGIQDRMVMVGKKSPQAFVYVSRVKMHDYGNPKFTLNPSKQATVSLWQLLKEAQSPEEEAVDVASAEAMEAAAIAADEAVAAYAVEAAKPVKAKAKKSKPKAKKAKS